MSVAGLAAARGTTLTAYRPSVTETDDADGAVSWGTPWTLRLYLEPIGAEIAQRVFGTAAQVTLRAYLPASVAPDARLELQDGVVIAAGPHAGAYRVRGLVPPHRVHPGAHWEVGLTSTLEVIP